MHFRSLRADEIDCRVQSVKENGLSILLYKDARVDQNILDETVGPMNWQRHHTRDNANCIVSIWDDDKHQWIEKEDTGTESYTEKEKGLASDSFKRACFNWGIGRELYTAPFIWIASDKCEIKNVKGKLTCYERFKVKNIEVSNSAITALKIVNSKDQTVFAWGNNQRTAHAEKPSKATEYARNKVTIKEQQINLLKAELERTGCTEKAMLNSVIKKYSLSQDFTVEQMTVDQYTWLMGNLKILATKGV